MTRSLSFRVLFLSAAVGFVVFTRHAPVAQSGEQNLGTLYTSPSCPACVSLGNSLSGSGWRPGTSPGTLVNGSSTITVINTNAPGAVVPSNINSIPAFTPAAGGSTLVGSSTINQHLTTAAQAHTITEQNVPPDQTPTENALTNTFQQSPTFQNVVDRLIDAATRGLAGFLQAAGLAPGVDSVSKYKNPDPGYLGYGPADRYSPPDPLHLAQLERALGHERQGRRETSVTRADPARLHQRGFSNTPNPRPLDTPGEGAKCGTKPGDRYWVGFPRGNILDCSCRCTEQIFCPNPSSPFFHVRYGGFFFEPTSCQACFPNNIKKHDYFVGLHHHGAHQPLPYWDGGTHFSGYQECRRQSVDSPAEEAKVEDGGGKPRRPFFGL